MSVAALVSGCAVCSNTYDCHYGAYGGSRQRSDRIGGRVASAFHDAEALVSEAVPGQVPLVEGLSEEMLPASAPPIALEPEATSSPTTDPLSPTTDPLSPGFDSSSPAEGGPEDPLPSGSARREIWSDDVAASLAEILELKQAPRQPLGEAAPHAGPFRLIGGFPQ